MRVLIAGGGIGGLATGLALRKLGIEPLILERKAALGEAGAGLGLYPNAMKALQYLGADALIRRVSIDSQTNENRILENDELIIIRQAAKTAALYGDKAYTVHRADLHQALAEQVPADCIRVRARVVAVEQTPSGVVARLDTGEEIEGDVLVGADGLRSNVRTSLFGEREARFTGIVTWRCLIPADRIRPRFRDIHTVWLGDNRHAMLYGVRQDTYCLNAFVPAAEVHAESWGVMGDVAELPGLYPGACDALREILEAVDSALVTPIYFRDPLEVWSKGRAVLLGDAAHPAPPSAGQGAAMALEDALALAHALKRHGRDGIKAAFGDYAARRKERTRRMLIASRFMLRVHNEPDARQREARNTWFKGSNQLDPTNSMTLDWLWNYDPVAVATAPEVPATAGPTPCLLKRPEARHAFDLLRHAITPEERSRQWVGEREGYARFLAEQCPAPADARIEPVDCGDVPGLLVTPAGGDGQGPAVLHLHGGGFDMGSAEGSARLAAHLARAAGGCALTVDYRLAPENPYPAALEDALAAYRWLRRRDPARAIVVSGEGAGGGLAVSLALALREAGEPLPRLLHLVSPFADMTLSGEGLKERAATEPLLDIGTLRNQAAAYIGGTDFRLPLVSPVFGDLTGLPPMLIQAAAGEALLDDARRLAAAAERAGVPVMLDLVEDSVHAFILFDFLPETQEALDRFAAFVAEGMREAVEAAGAV